MKKAITTPMTRDIKAINDYLEIYRQNAKAFYTSLLNEFFEAAPDYTKAKQFLRTAGWAVEKDTYDAACKTIKEFTQKLKRERKVNGSYHEGYGKPYWVEGPWHPIERYALLAYDNKTSTWNRATMEAEIDKDLEDDVQAKYEKIVNRVTPVVGDITDAKGLSVAPTGELNGLIKGTQGACTVTTFSAGGWNIQRFHFRVSVRKVA